MVNIVAIIATLLSLIGVIIALAQAVIKDFVHVTIPTNVSGVDADKCEIAKLGVYQTDYDSSCLDPETLARSRVPDEKYTVKTSEFKLLFPAQENFVAEVLPTSPEVLAQFDAVSNNQASALLGGVIDKINNQAFDNCEQYMNETETNLLTLFNRLNNVLLPGVIPLLTGPGVALIDGGLNQILPVFQNTSNPLAGFMLGTFSLVVNGTSASCGVNDPTAELSDEVLGCVGQVYQGAAAQAAGSPAPEQPIVDLVTLMSNLFSQCSAGATALSITLSVIDCVGSVRTGLQDTAYFAPAQMFGVPQQTDSLCNAASLWPACNENTTRAEVVSELFNIASIFAAGGDTQSAAAAEGLGLVGALLRYLSPALAVTNQTDVALREIIDQFASSAVAHPQPFPSSFSSFYVPCGLLQVSAATSNQFAGIPGSCPFSQFFGDATSFVVSAGLGEFAPLLEQLDTLYGACNQALLVAPNACGTFFPSLFIAGAYANEFPVSDFLLKGPHAVFQDAVSSCEDDVKDKKAVLTAESMLAFSIAVYVLAFVTGIIASVSSRHVTSVSVVAAVLAILAVATNFGALIIVSNAPVYQSVGEPPKDFSPLYTAGIVANLAVGDAIVNIIAAILFVAAACMASRSSDGAAVEESEGKVAMTDEKAEDKAPAPEAKVEAEDAAV